MTMTMTQLTNVTRDCPRCECTHNCQLGDNPDWLAFLWQSFLLSFTTSERGKEAKQEYQKDESYASIIHIYCLCQSETAMFYICFLFWIHSSKNWQAAAHSRWDLQCIILDMFLILSFGFLCLWPAAAHSRWEGQYDKCIAGGGGADTGRFLCSASSNCSALLFLYFSVLLFHIYHRRTQVYCKSGGSPHPPLLTFCPTSMLILIHIHA